MTTVLVERRFTEQPVGTRAGNRRIGGYAAVFEKRSRNLGGFVEVVDRTAFNRAMGNNWPDVAARFNHDNLMVLGTTAAGTLRLAVDNVGLAYEVDVPQTRQDVYELVERGDIRSSSFAFSKIEDDWGLSDQGYPERRLLSVQLIDVAPVGGELPAYPDATAGLRSLAQKFEADLTEVRSLAEANELRKFFVQTMATATLFGAQALANALSKPDPVI